MGFRDLRSFNLAMLAKQGWRLLQDQDSILFQCLKARYFPRCHFLDAVESHNCSYTWKSIMAAMPILKQGCCWRVGNGSTIRVKGDKWIPNYLSNGVLYPAFVEDEEWMVEELIDPDLNWWNKDLIMARFHRDDAEAICRIPLSHRQVSDCIFWLHTKDGVYSCKSGYQVARQVLRVDDGAESSSGPSGQRVWSKLWHLRVPNKIKVFGWRACLDILPTRVNLTKRKVIADNICLCCRSCPETSVHVLWECGAAQDVWAGCLMRFQKTPNRQMDTLQLFEDLMDRTTRTEFELFLVQAWFIWNQRNTVNNGGRFKEPGCLNKRAIEYLEEFHNSQAQLSIPTHMSSTSSWKPPPVGVYKVNFDAAVFAEMNCSGFGAIVRNNMGEVMAAMSVKGPPVTCSEEAEILACRKALEFSVDAGFSNVIIEGDNDTVIRAISSSSRSQSWLGNIYGDVKWLMSGIQVICVTCVKREGNEVANVLARYAKNIVDEVFWIEDSPPPAYAALYHDSINIS